MQFTFQTFNPLFTQAVTAASGGLQVLFWGDADLLHGMLAAADLDRALVAAVMNLAVIKTITKTLFGAFEK